jgi:hypothetical protein
MIGIGAASRVSAHSGLAEFSNLAPHNQNIHIQVADHARPCLVAPKTFGVQIKFP